MKKNQLVTGTKVQNSAQEKAKLLPTGVEANEAKTGTVKPEYDFLKELADKAIQDHHQGISSMCTLLEFSAGGTLKFSEQNHRTTEVKTFKAKWKWDGKLEIDFTDMIRINTKTEIMENTNEEHLYPVGAGPENAKEEKPVTKCDMIEHILANDANWTEALLEKETDDTIIRLYKSIAPADYSLNAAGAGPAKNDEEEKLLPNI
jgi:hypothetical protein